MSRITFSDTYKDFVVSLFQGIEKGDLEYIFKGEVTSTVVTNILDLAKLNLEDNELRPISSRIYFILGEGLQNISRHQEKIDDGTPTDSIILISKKDNKYSITTGNLIKTDKKEELEDKLTRINSMSVDELREFARYIRKNYTLSEKGGANLGLVEMAKRSGSQLLYGFKDFDNEYSFFYFSIQLDLIEIGRPTELKSHASNYKYINFLKKFHQTLSDQNIYLVFKGDFHQNNILALFDILRKQMAETVVSIKLKNILIEVLQNIEKHGDNIHDITDWKPGIVTVHQKGDEYFLTASNYISNSKIPQLKTKINKINSLTKEELNKYYRESLLDFNKEITSKKTGLGYIDIRRRSGNELFIDFIKLNENSSLFFIQIAIKDKNKK
ncbi:MAG: SiaB family protein kinase [Bacteroidales bacterium]|nr:SiaB family protein kinase [Bacteroidales bacterium]